MKILDLVKKFKSSPEKRAVAQLNRYIAKAESYGVGGRLKAAMIGITDEPIPFTKTDRISTKGFTINMYKQLTSTLGDIDVWIAEEKKNIDNDIRLDNKKRKVKQGMEDLWEDYYEVHDTRGWRKRHKSDWASVKHSGIASREEEIQALLEKRMVEMGDKLRLETATAEEIYNLSCMIREAKAGVSYEALRRKYG